MNSSSADSNFIFWRCEWAARISAPGSVGLLALLGDAGRPCSLPTLPLGAQTAVTYGAHTRVLFVVNADILTRPRIPFCLHKAFQRCFLFACRHPGCDPQRFVLCWQQEVSLGSAVQQLHAALLCSLLTLQLFRSALPQLHAWVCSRDCSGLSDGPILPSLGSIRPREPPRAQNQPFVCSWCFCHLNVSLLCLHAVFLAVKESQQKVYPD